MSDEVRAISMNVVKQNQDAVCVIALSADYAIVVRHDARYPNGNVRTIPIEETIYACRRLIERRSINTSYPVGHVYSVLLY